MKKILTIAFALTMVFALAACNGDKAPAPSGSTDTGTGQQQEQPSNTPDGNTQSSGENTQPVVWPDDAPIPQPESGTLISVNRMGEETFKGAAFFDMDGAAVKKYAEALIAAGFELNPDSWIVNDGFYASLEADEDCMGYFIKDDIEGKNLIIDYCSGSGRTYIDVNAGKYNMYVYFENQ